LFLACTISSLDNFTQRKDGQRVASRQFHRHATLPNTLKLRRKPDAKKAVQVASNPTLNPKLGNTPLPTFRLGVAESCQACYHYSFPNSTDLVGHHSQKLWSGKKHGISSARYRRDIL
jgi:hypothetical protein